MCSAKENAEAACAPVILADRFKLAGGNGGPGFPGFGGTNEGLVIVS